MLGCSIALQTGSNSFEKFSCLTVAPSPGDVTHAKAQLNHDLEQKYVMDARYPRVVMRVEQPIWTQQQLFTHAIAIFEDLEAREAHCINKSSNLIMDNEMLKPGEWIQHIACHRNLPDTYYDICLVIWHPNAPQAIRKMTTIHRLEERISKRAIQCFIEGMLRHLPASKEYLLAFLWDVYDILTTLLDALPYLCPTSRTTLQFVSKWQHELTKQEMT